MGVFPWWWQSSELAWEMASRERWRGREGEDVASRIRAARYAARIVWSELTGRARTAADDAKRTHLSFPEIPKPVRRYAVVAGGRGRSGGEVREDINVVGVDVRDLRMKARSSNEA